MVGITLFMNDVGGSEVLVIVLVALMFFGSKSIPGIAKSMGSAMRQIRDAQNGIQDEIRKGGESMRKDLNLAQIIEETEQEVSQPFEKATRDLNTGLTFEPPRNPSAPNLIENEITIVGEESENSKIKSDEPTIEETKIEDQR